MSTNEVLVPVVDLSKWETRIENARKRGEFIVQEKEKSGSWTCCAVGERDTKCKQKIDKNQYDSLVQKNGDVNRYVRTLVSSKAFELGIDFNTAVDDNDFDGADKIISKIEALEVNEFYEI